MRCSGGVVFALAVVACYLLSAGGRGAQAYVYMTTDCTTEDGARYYPGDSWDVTGKCERCDCVGDRAHCMGCGSVGREGKLCYLESPAGPHSTYPQCCPRHVCPGQAGYDAGRAASRGKPLAWRNT